MAGGRTEDGNGFDDMTSAAIRESETATVPPAQVVFVPSGRRGVFEAGTTVLDAARQLGVDLDSVCGGRGICGRCQVTIGHSPDIPADPSRLSPPGPTEFDYRGRKPLVEGRRLGCATRVVHDVVIEVPPDSQIHRQVVRKRPEVESFPVDPVCRLHYTEIDPPVLEAPSGDVERLCSALERDWGLVGLGIDPELIPAVQKSSREGPVTVAVRDGNRIVAIWPGFVDRLFGIAFDVGSTTLAGHLVDLADGTLLASEGRMNPQIGFGEDLMSRVTYAMTQPEGSTHLTTVVRRALDDLLGELVAVAGTDRDRVLELVLVGNPIMHHLVLGFDPTPLGSAPFALATTSGLDVRASSLDLAVHGGARAHFLPCIAGHVGADTSAAVLSEAPYRGDAVQLLVDVGTNAELVLGNRHRLLAASSPTGPAFEGAQISAGQRAAPGAIERVRIDRETLEPRIKVIDSDAWSDEDGFDPGAVTGICGSGIIEAIAELFLSGVINADGVIVAGSTGRVVVDGRTHSYVLWNDPEVRITQTDIRAIQLAKGALHAGARLLMDRLGVTSVDEIRLAGAFGSHIDPKYAMVLGMIPDCELDRVSSAGNAAGTGALMALVSGTARREIEDVSARIEKIETATEPDFQSHFVEAMGIPHRTDAYPKLAARIGGLPARSEPTTRRRRSKESK